jgi:hypothetical protein
MRLASVGSVRPDPFQAGYQRHLLVDILGLPLSIYVTSADVQDRVGARSLLAGLKPLSTFDVLASVKAADPG